MAFFVVITGFVGLFFYGLLSGNASLILVSLILFVLAGFFVNEDQPS